MENSYSIVISDEKKLVSVKPEGHYNLEGVKKIIEKIIDDPSFDPGYDIILNHLDVEYTPVVSEIFELSKFIISRKASFKGRTAIILKNDLLHNLYKLATLFVFKEGIRTNLFYTEEEAIEWLEKNQS